MCPPPPSQSLLAAHRGLPPEVMLLSGSGWVVSSKRILFGEIEVGFLVGITLYVSPTLPS